MKKLILLLSIILLSCNPETDDGCKCEGKYQRLNNTNGFFYIGGIDCATGEPGLSQQNAGQLGIDNPAFYRGCND